MASEKLANRLHLLPFAGALAPEVFAGFADTMEAVGAVEMAAPDTVLFKEGDPQSDLGVVLLSGGISVKKTESPGLDVPAPELLGEISRFNPTGLRTATVTTKRECQLMRFTWANFEEAARGRMAHADYEALMKALEEYAWQHFTQ